MKVIQLFRTNISEKAIRAVEKVLRSGWIGLGPKTAEFEEKFAKYVGVKYAVAVNSGTAALHLALVVSGIKKGDEVITTPLTFISTNHVVLYQEAVPVFAEIDPATYCISTSAIEKLITPKTKAIMCVHYGGYPCDIDGIYKIAKKYNLKVIEDAAHACGSSYRGKRIGSFGLTCFSFHAVKNLPLGDGGMITTNNKKQYERLKRLRWLGINKSTYARSGTDKEPSAYLWRYNVPEIGFKYHMNDINAAIGIEQLKLLDKQNAYRRKLAAIYNKELNHPDIIAFPPVLSSDMLTSQHLYVLQVKRRENLINKLEANGINPGVHYLPNNLFPMYRNCRNNAKGAVKIAKHLISLPMHTCLAEKDIFRITKIINKGW